MTVPAEVLQEIGFSVYEDVINRKDILAVDRKAMPFADFVSKITKTGGSATGEARVLLKKSGGTEVQFWERRDTLGFVETTVDLELEYSFYNEHMGLEVVHDDLLKQGYQITYNGPRGKNFAKKQSADELNRLADILQEKIETLMDDWKVQNDLILHRDGSYDSKAIPGLDALVSPTNTGTVGGKSRTNPLLQHTIKTGATTTAGGNLYTYMTQAWRAANLNGRGHGARVDFIMAGSAFIDGYTAWRMNNNWNVNQAGAGQVKKVDIAIPDSGLEFMGIPIVYNPTMDYLAVLEPSASPAWNKRCYFLSSKALQIVTPAGMDMQFSSPADLADQRFTRFSLDKRLAFMNKIPNAHALVSIA